MLLCVIGILPWFPLDTLFLIFWKKGAENVKNAYMILEWRTDFWERIYLVMFFWITNLNKNIRCGGKCLQFWHLGCGSKMIDWAWGKVQHPDTYLPFQKASKVHSTMLWYILHEQSFGLDVKLTTLFVCFISQDFHFLVFYNTLCLSLPIFHEVMVNYRFWLFFFLLESCYFLFNIWC